MRPYESLSASSHVHLTDTVFPQDAQLYGLIQQSSLEVVSWSETFEPPPEVEYSSAACAAKTPLVILAMRLDVILRHLNRSWTRLNVGKNTSVGHFFSLSAIRDQGQECYQDLSNMN